MREKYKIMTWEKEYKNSGVLNWQGSKVFVHKTPNYRLEIQLGSGVEVEMYMLMD